MGLAIGSLAPDFTLHDHTRAKFVLSQTLQDKAVLLVFYPFAFSGVCTGELTGFRDHLGEVETEVSTLVAVSCDPAFSLRAFADRDALFFPLLSDFWPHGAVASDYDVFDPALGAARRSSYLIKRDGTIAWAMHHEIGEARDLGAHAAAIRALG